MSHHHPLQQRQQNKKLGCESEAGNAAGVDPPGMPYHSGQGAWDPLWWTGHVGIILTRQNVSYILTENDLWSVSWYLTPIPHDGPQILFSPVIKKTHVTKRQFICEHIG